MLKTPRIASAFFLGFVILQSTGCTAIAVVDAAASAAIGVTKVAVKGTTAAVGALIPDGDDDEDEKDD